MADLNKNESQACCKIRLQCEDVQGKSVLTNFHGMSFTSDKLKSLVRKWHMLIEAHTDVKTTDGYLIRVFCIGFTKQRANQVKKTTYAQTAQIRQIRKRMTDVIKRDVCVTSRRSFSSWHPKLLGVR